MLEPENGALISNTTHYGSPNLASYPYLNPDNLNNSVIYPPQEVTKRLFYQSFVDAQTNAFYAEIWEAFRHANRLSLENGEADDT